MNEIKISCHSCNVVQLFKPKGLEYWLPEVAISASLLQIAMRSFPVFLK